MNDRQKNIMRGAFQSLSHKFPVGKTELSVVFVKEETGTITDFGFKVKSAISLSVMRDASLLPMEALKVLNGQKLITTWDEIDYCPYSDDGKCYPLKRKQEENKERK